MPGIGFVRFVLSDMPLLYAKMGKMFGVLPSELLKLDAFEMGVNIACMQAYDRNRAESIKRLPKGSLMPVIEPGE